MSSWIWFRNVGSRLNVSCPQTKSIKAIPAAYYDVIETIGSMSDNKKRNFGLSYWAFKGSMFLRHSYEIMISCVCKSMFFTLSSLLLSLEIILSMKSW